MMELISTPNEVKLDLDWSNLGVLTKNPNLSKINALLAEIWTKMCLGGYHIHTCCRLRQRHIAYFIMLAQGPPHTTAQPGCRSDCMDNLPCITFTWSTSKSTHLADEISTQLLQPAQTADLNLMQSLQWQIAMYHLYMIRQQINTA